MRSIKVRLIFLYLALVFIVMLVSGSLMIIRTRISEVDRMEEELVLFSSIVMGNIINNTQNTEQDFPRELNRQIQTYSNKDIEAFILDGNGYNIDPNNPTPQISNTINAAILGRAASNLGNTGIIDYGEPCFNSSGKVSYIVYVRMPTDSMEERMAEVTMTVVIAALVAIVLSVVIGMLFSKTLTGPIIMLTRKAGEWAKGDLQAPELIEVHSEDEIGELTQTFNEMSAELSKTLESITTEKNKMEILLHNMSDGVLAYDREGKLIDANYSAQDQLGINNLTKYSFREIFDKLGIMPPEDESGNKIVYETDSEWMKNLQDTTIYIGRKYIGMIFSPYYNAHGRLDGVVIVLQDITKLKKLDDMRKEFVANVSHELRTPLTTVKTYTETLLDGAIEDKDIAVSFLETIEKEADRMTVLVKDLLELSRLDNNQFSMDIKRVDLIEIIIASIEQVEVIAKQKEQAIHFDDPGIEYGIMADSSRIRQVLTNVLGNAVKYSGNNTNIYVNLECSERFYRVYVRDQGFGIAKDDLQHIFERFYRVDKARSREMGGTGLGLSIAKEIMEAQGFKISANSDTGKGTTMILRFNRV